MPPLWKRTSNYLKSRSTTLLVTGGLVGGIYILSQYAINKLKQMQDKMVQDRNSKENLRRRFSQNQEDCTFTVLALLPTLGDQLFEKLDVEGLTKSLQAQPNPQTRLPAKESPDTFSTGDASINPETTSSAVQTSQQTPFLVESEGGSSITGNSGFNPLAKPFVPGDALPRGEGESTTTDTENSERVSPPVTSTLGLNSGVDNQSSSGESVAQVQLDAKKSAETSAQIVGKSSEDLIAEKKAKLQLWNELKVVAFARTFTALYCIVLLTLQTHIQLNLIGRFAYLSSVESQARAQEARAATHCIRLQSRDALMVDENDPEESGDDCDPDAKGGLDHDTERFYLTFSWWFLHRGWERLSDKVQEAVEDVFSGLPLKAQLSWADLQRCITDVRERVEFQDKGFACDGAKGFRSRSNFLALLFPASLEEEQETLVQAGALTSAQAKAVTISDAQLRALLDETKDTIESEDFSDVLRLCLDKVFDVFSNTMTSTFGIGPIVDHGNPAGDAHALVPRFQELTSEGHEGRKVRLASLFPAVARQSQLAINGVPNPYIESLSEVRELRALSAIIYSAW
ncbi:hypothetical protein IE53DRAFT_387433 [Violaceomyces palustris]|uniref:Uncharacterized protein n=1 Tax=Violaceomyces palustris TaxID=1673888 RepID=A0ACD0NWS1_9BASI|nr:hypothetical protein IE53DRAFT_387433 [Violaceomyces palustris]